MLPRDVGHDGRLLACAHEHVERPVGGLGEGLHRQDRVDEPVLEEVLGRLDALGEGPLVERLVDPGAEEPDHRSRLRHGDLPERAPRREDAAGRRVTEVDEVGQPGSLELRTGRADLHHPDEGRRPLLHAGPSRGRRGKHRQLLAAGPLERHDDPLGRHRPDRPREEAELAGDDGHAAPPDPALARDDGLVAPAALASGSQLSGIRRSPSGAGCAGALSQLAHEPSSRTVSSSSGAPSAAHLLSHCGPARRARRAPTRCAPRAAGGCRCAGSPAGKSVVVEADRRPGDLDRPEHRVVDVEDQPLRRRLLPLVDVGRRSAPRRPGHPTSASARDELVEAVGRRRPPSISAMRRSRFATRSRLVARPGVAGSMPNAVGELDPQPLAADRRSGPCRPAAEQAVRRDRRVVVALRAADLAGDGVSRALEGVHPDDGREQGGAHDAPAPGAGPARAGRPRRRRRRTSRRAGHRSGRRPAAGRRGRCRSATSGRPRPGRSGRSRRARPPGPSWPKPLIDRITRRGLSSCSRSVGEAEAVEDAGAEVLDEDVRRGARGAVRVSRPSSDLRSRVIDSLLRLHER